MGYRMFDSAEVYLNEVEVGDGIERCYYEGLIKRE